MKQLELSHYLSSPALTEHCCIVLCPQVSPCQAKPGPCQQAHSCDDPSARTCSQSVILLIEYTGTPSRNVTTQGNRSGAVGEGDYIIIIIVIHLSDDYELYLNERLALFTSMSSTALTTPKRGQELGGS